MKAADLALVVAVGAFAAFVGVMVSRRPPAPALPTPRQAAVETTPNRRDERPDVVVPSSNAAPERDMTDIRRRIADVPESYLPAMLQDQHGFLVRWPDRSTTGLRVWVQARSDVRDWSTDYAQMARDAFSDWQEGLPARLDFIYDSASADVRVVWSEKFSPGLGLRVGVTTRAVDRFGWLASAQIVIAIHDSAGRTIPPEDLAGIARHEAGHALGLGHSPDPGTKMFPVERVRNVQPADRATLRLLYTLPPGRVAP